MNTPDRLTDEEAYPAPRTLPDHTRAVLAYEKDGIEWLDPKQLALVTEHFKNMWMEIVNGHVQPIKN